MSVSEIVGRMACVIMIGVLFAWIGWQVTETYKGFWGRLVWLLCILCSAALGMCFLILIL